MHGRGTLTQPNGITYEGEMVRDKREGHGVYKWPDGRYYEGGWLKG